MHEEIGAPPVSLPIPAKFESAKPSASAVGFKAPLDAEAIAARNVTNHTSSPSTAIFTDKAMKQARRLNLFNTAISSSPPKKRTSQEMSSGTRYVHLSFRSGQSL